MALRVLLADESATIKKVFQLSLQDFAVEVTSVNVGLDVLAVATKTKPDIVFVDVLLQKRNGYEVCTDLKKNPQLASVPVVLIWSGFMELDQKKFKACGANAELEKPFDTEKLRQLVTALVPKTKNQSISGYLNFPKMPDFEEPAKISVTSQKVIAPPPPPIDEEEELMVPAPPPMSETETFSSRPIQYNSQPETSAADEDWSMESFAPLPHPLHPVESEAEAEDGEWVSKTLTQYKMDKKKLLEEPEAEFEIPEDKIDADSVISPPPLKDRIQATRAQIRTTEEPPELPLDLDSPDGEIELEMPHHSSPMETATRAGLSEKQIEAIIRSEARLMIEKVVWEIVPEIATQIIEREIRRILKDNDDSTP